MPDTGVARRLRLTGHVQGVGYRPFVYRLARELGVRGWVKNATGAVEIHAEGPGDTLYEFTLALVERAPAIARPHLALDRAAEFEGHAGFAILASAADAEPDIHVPPARQTWLTCSPFPIAPTEPHAPPDEQGAIIQADHSVGQCLHSTGNTRVHAMPQVPELFDGDGQGEKVFPRPVGMNR